MLQVRPIGSEELLRGGCNEIAGDCYRDVHQRSNGEPGWIVLGRAYESLGDRARAVKCYKQVAGYESHPLAPEAHEALQRLQATT